MNRFEQVFSDHHQMSLAGGSTGLMPREQSDVLGEAVGNPPDLSWGWVPYHVTFLMIHLMLPPPPPL